MQVNPYALRAIRQRSGLSVSQLARRAGISQPHLSNIEAGKRGPSPETAHRLAQALRVPLLALLAEPGVAPSDSTDGLDPGECDRRRSSSARDGPGHAPGSWPMTSFHLAVAA